MSKPIDIFRGFNKHTIEKLLIFSEFIRLGFLGAHSIGIEFYRRQCFIKINPCFKIVFATIFPIFFTEEAAFLAQIFIEFEEEESPSQIGCGIRIATHFPIDDSRNMNMFTVIPILDHDITGPHITMYQRIFINL